MIHANDVWLDQIVKTSARGRTIETRGRRVLELDHQTTTFDMRAPLIRSPEGRRLSYRFACAEAAWIISGSDRLDEIEPWAARMREFSDDGAVEEPSPG